MLTRKETPICELCGAPLQSPAAEEGCLNCLLRTGIDGERETSLPPPNESRSRIYQHFEILTRPDGSLWELGRGALGVTYKARDVNLDTPVALKIINPRFSAGAEARHRLRQEAQAAAQLRHPNVAKVLHFGTSEPVFPARATQSAEEDSGAGECFYAMEFIEGESLAERVRRTGPLEPVVTLEIALQVSRALAAAEKNGLVHRGLKPSNIMLVASDEAAPARRARGAGWIGVKVIDFGLARLARAGSEPSMSRGRWERLAFASPEQIQGGEVNGRSNIYSLGMVILFAFTGKTPLSRPAMGEAGAAPASVPPPVAQLRKRGIPAPVIALLESMLASAPEDRPRSALELGERLQDTFEALPAARSARHLVRAAGLGLAACLIGLAIYLFSPPASPDDKSIAVLPFQNLGRDPANAFFAEGVQDDILSRLVKIRDLKVMSRLGTSRYPAGAPRDLRAIGRALGVRHLLEGSLRRDGDRVRLHVSLIDTRNGNEVWSEGYDRRLVDAIHLQGELASDVADALDATLSPNERVNVRSNSTRNPDAYVLYLEGRKLENNPAFAISAYEGAEALYRQAVVLDPGFALAHARLATTLGLLYRFRGPGEDLKSRAQAEARAALRLQPDLGEAHLAQGLCHYRIERDYERALPELEIARRLLPNDTEAETTIAFIHRREGRWREARAGQERVLARDPLNGEYEHEIYATAVMLRDWPAAAAHAARATALAPKMDPLRGERVLVDLWQNGNLAPLQEFFAGLTGFGDPEGNLAWERWDAAMLARDFGAAQRAIDRFPFETLPSVLSAPLPKSYFEGCVWLAQGQNARAQQFFETARPAMEAETLVHPDDGLRHSRLGLLYAYMSRKNDAIREGERGVELTPVAEDAIDGHQRLCNLALIHARVGDAQEAITMIESLLREPGCVSPVNEASMSLWELRLRWQWDPLRNDPRFQKILAALEPLTVF